MSNYYELPEYFRGFLKPFDYLGTIADHQCSVVFFNTDQVLTEFAQQWFADRGFELCEQHVFFEKPAHTVGPIHSDGIEDDYSEYGNNYAFNWVVQGHGIMEWIELTGREQRQLVKVTVPVDVYYHAYQGIQNYQVIDSWSGSMALVNVKTPHRVNTHTESRYCLSVRTKANRGPVTFDQALQAII